ncbi:UNVERIFIED_CONTAM: hypothetical protein Sradi_4362000 [Sesamum radiatum]|uniref:Uncharacterized protein n=1 Tax=Sesamum radiatum TaxID=300843 RepID=A0AAW2NPA6_SESRA
MGEPICRTRNPGIAVAPGYCSTSRYNFEFGMLPSLQVAGLAKYNSARTNANPT